MHSVTIARNILQSNSLGWLVRQLQGVPSGVDLNVDMSDLGFVNPVGLAVLTAFLKKHQRNGNRISIQDPRNQNVMDYINRVGFYDQIGVHREYPWQKHDPAGRFIELQNPGSEEEGERAVSDIVKILQHNSANLQGVLDGIEYAFYEIVNNVFHHAQSPVSGVLAAQFYTDEFRPGQGMLRVAGRVEIAVVDMGQGIYGSMSKRFSLSGNEEAIRKALKPRVTSRPEYNSGEGLFFTSEIIRENQGSMVIYSHDGGMKITADKMTYEPGAFWPGTIVWMQFQAERTLDLQALFNRFAPPDDDYNLIFD
ncbi:hypothetical protein D6779_02705 [Candidatus Parcubacteria bacterium]|nr:MAG: hypothetical protein D6779_02705 [Candidatus Parcubacteria bacterium]